MGKQCEQSIYTASVIHRYINLQYLDFSVCLPTWPSSFTLQIVVLTTYRVACRSSDIIGQLFFCLGGEGWNCQLFEQVFKYLQKYSIEQHWMIHLRNTQTCNYENVSTVLTIGTCYQLIHNLHASKAHPVYKIWIIQEPNTLELWNKLHFEEKKTENIHHV